MKKYLRSFSFAFAVIRFDGGFVILDVTPGLVIALPVIDAEDVADAEDFVVFVALTVWLADDDRAEADDKTEATAMDAEVTGIWGGGSDGSADDDAVAVFDVTKEEATLGATLCVDNVGVTLMAEGIV